MSTLTIWLLLVVALAVFLYYDMSVARRFFQNTGGPSSKFFRWWLSENVRKFFILGGVLVVVTLALYFQGHTLVLPDFGQRIKLPKMVRWGLLTALALAAFVLFDLLMSRRFYRNNPDAHAVEPRFFRWWLRRSAVTFIAVGMVASLALGGIWAARRYNLLQAKSETSGYMASAQRYFGEKKYREATLELRNALKQNQGDYEAYLWLGRASWQLGKLTEARDAYREAIRLEPKLYAAHLELSRLGLALKDPDTVLSAASQALLLEPKAAEPHLLLAQLYSATGKREQALEQCRDVLGKKFSSPELRQQFVMLLITERSFTEALQAAEEGVKESPNDTGLKLLRAEVLQRLGRMGEAETVLRAAATASTSAAPCLALGDLLLGRGDEANATIWYEETLKRDPNQYRAMNNVATLTARSGFNLDRAAALAARLYAKSPGNPDVADTLGWTLFLQGKTGEALPLLKLAVTKKPGTPLHHYHLGAALLKNGNQTAGRKELEAALRLSGTFYGAEKARALLKTAGK